MLVFHKILLYNLIFLEGKKVEPEDLEDILLDVMAREFHVNLEDLSEREIARLLFDLFRESIKGEDSLLKQLRAQDEKRKIYREDVVSQSQGIDQVEEVDSCYLDPEYLNEDEEDDDEEM